MLSAFTERSALGPEEEVGRRDVGRALEDTLPDPRRRAILGMRFVDGMTLREIGAEVNLSCERVRQIIASSLLRLHTEKFAEVNGIPSPVTGEPCAAPSPPRPKTTTAPLLMTDDVLDAIPWQERMVLTRLRRETHEQIAADLKLSTRWVHLMEICGMRDLERLRRATTDDDG